MKVVTFAEFAALPEGTVFSIARGDPQEVHLQVKLRMAGDRSWVSRSISTIVNGPDELPEFLPEWPHAFRDGHEPRFIIYEQADLVKLIELIAPSPATGRRAQLIRMIERMSEENCERFFNEGIDAAVERLVRVMRGASPHGATNPAAVEMAKIVTQPAMMQGHPPQQASDLSRPQDEAPGGRL